MKHRTSFALAFVLVTALAAPLAARQATGELAADAGGHAADRETLRHLKLVEWPRAYREQDAELLDRILAEEFEKIGFDGTRTSKADELAHVRANRPDYDTFVFEITRLDVFENGTAIVSGTGTIEGSDAEGPYTATYSSSNVLVKRATAWKAVASHVSGLTIVRPAAAP